jgi:hypothetical protein
MLGFASSPQRSWRLSPPQMMKDVFTMERGRPARKEKPRSGRDARAPMSFTLTYTRYTRFLENINLVGHQEGIFLHLIVLEPHTKRRHRHSVGQLD